MKQKIACDENLQYSPFFEWGGGCLWCGNDAAKAKFNLGPIEGDIGLSQLTKADLDAMSVWHDTALDWSNPSGPSPWGDEEFRSFDAAARAMAHRLQEELGPEFEVVYES